jgi:flap endonuclease-1
MGISGFTKVFTPTLSETTLEKQVKEKRVVVDGFSEIYRAFLGMGRIAGLTNKIGESTQHINIVLCNTLKIMISGAKSLVWVFDTRASDLKQDEQDKRQNAKAKAQDEQDKVEAEIAKIKEQVDGMEPDDIKEIFGDFDLHMADLNNKFERLKTRTYRSIGGKMVDDIKFLLDCLGIPYINAPNGIEGEQIAGKMCQTGLADIVITNDTDSPLFGCAAILKKIPKKSGKYDLYTLPDILKQEDITMDQLIEIGICLGCDFAEKVPRVGPKTVVKKVKAGKIEYSDKQNVAMDYFKQDCDIPDPVNVGSTMTTKSLDTLKKWLTEEQSFAVDRMNKALKPLYDDLQK